MAASGHVDHGDLVMQDVRIGLVEADALLKTD